jgi:hypothetical protein
MKKVAGIGLGLALCAFGVFQMVHGFQQCNGKRELHWSGKRAATVESGDFVVKIPAGWRDASEATDQELKDLLAKQPGAHVMVREDFDGAIILVKTAPGQDVGDKPPCDEVANTIAKQEGATATNIKPTPFDGDPGCAWTEGKGDVVMLYNLRFHGATMLLVACGGGTPGYEAACQQAIASVSLVKH